MKKRTHSPTRVNFSEFALKRDKQIASVEMRDYFVSKNRQEKAWQLMTAVINSLRQNIFSTAEAKKITEFLARKFEIRLPMLEYALAVNPSANPHKPNSGNIRSDHRIRQKDERVLFYQLFIRLQAGVQENLLDYNGACVLVGEIVSRYPKARGSLQQ